MLQLLNTFAVNVDLPILEWIQAHLQSGLMDTIMPIITLFGEGGIFWIALALLMLSMPKTRKTGLAMGLALIMGLVICNMILKPIVHRPRPYDFQLAEFGKTIKLLIEAQSDFSFPSGHTIASFEASVVLLLNNKRLGIPAVILAVLVSFSRLYLYVHYPSDVIVSVILGTLFAFIANAIVQKYCANVGRRGKYQR